MTLPIIVDILLVTINTNPTHMNSIRQRFENVFGKTELITRGGYDTAFRVRDVDVYVDKEAGEYIMRRKGITVDGLDQDAADKFLTLLAE